MIILKCKYPSVTFTSIELENFASLKSGMNVNRLFIDFTKLNHTITLLVGENGTGKTSVLRCLHPFAYNSASGDDRDNAELIIEGMDGRKRLLIGYLDDEYDVEHIYTRKKDTLTVKSYLKKNGEELNPSGNVTSFKNLMETIFDLKESYLSLLSIGNTVLSFVKFTASERKKFAIKLFSILDIYSMFYKNATAMVREIKPVLSNVTAKLERYRSYNLEDMEKERGILERSVVSLNDTLKDVLIEIGELTNGVKQNQSTIDQYDAKQHRVMELLDTINTLQAKGISRSVNDVDAELTKANLDLTKITTSEAMTKDNIERELQYRDERQKRLSELTTKVGKMESDVDINELVQLKIRLENEYQNLSLPNLTRPTKSSSELIRSKIYIDELRGQCIDLITDVINQNVIEPTITRYLKNHEHLIGQLMEQCDNQAEDLEAFKASQAARHLIPKRIITSIKGVTCDTKDTCPYARFYQKVYEILSRTADDADATIQELEERHQLAQDQLTAAKIIEKLYGFIKRYPDEFHLPIEIFDPEQFLFQYMDDRDICNRDLLNEQIGIAERFERGENLQNQISTVIDKINAVESSRELYDSMHEEITSIQSALSIIEERLEFFRKDQTFYENRVTELSLQITKLSQEKKLSEELEDSKLEMSVVKEEIAAIEDSMKSIRLIQTKLDQLTAREEKLRSEIKEKQDRINQINQTLDLIHSLEEEQADLFVKLNQRIAIQQAVSPVSGIPLEFINDFIKHDLIQMVNDILDTVYHGRLRLDGENTIIDDSDFIIPYIINGTWVRDISRASDGQKAILTLAFSISLIKMTGSRYNIMLLDEMDTTLDVGSKAIFIELLENYAKEINAWMIFLISHNSMFDGHPVNILLTSDEVVSNTQDATIVRLYEGGTMDE